MLIGAAWNQLEAYRAEEAHGAPGGESRQDERRDVEPEADKGAGGLARAGRTHEAERREDPDKLEAMRGSYSSVFRIPGADLAQYESWLQYRYFFDIFSMMLIGMALFKMGLLHLGHPRRPYVWMVLVGYGIGLTVNFFEVRHLLNCGFDVLARLRAEVSYDVGRLAMTAGHVGLSDVVVQLGVPRMAPAATRRGRADGADQLRDPLDRVPRCSSCGFGFGLYGHLARHQLYYVVVAIWAFQLVISPIWLAYYRFGPLEWLWRSLTYGERQPMRRVAGSGRRRPDRPGILTTRGGLGPPAPGDSGDAFSRPFDGHVEQRRILADERRRED